MRRQTVRNMRHEQQRFAEGSCLIAAARSRRAEPVSAFLRAGRKLALGPQAQQLVVAHARRGSMMGEVCSHHTRWALAGLRRCVVEGARGGITDS